MNAKWKHLCRESGLKYTADSILITYSNGRRQKVYIDESTPNVIRLWSTVARRSSLHLEQPEIEAWLVNRYRELVGFKVAERGTIIGEAWIPLVEDLSTDEWSLYVRTLAKACDRLEYLWTGADRDWSDSE